MQFMQKKIDGLEGRIKMMVVSRYVKTICVIFRGDVRVPIWECKYEEDDYFGNVFKYEDERTTHIEEAIYDFKKKEFVSFFTIEMENKKEVLEIGTRVVNTEGSYTGLVSLTKIKSIVEGEPEVYYDKVSAFSKKDIEKYNIPSTAKIVVKKHRQYMYVLEGSNEPVHEVHIKKVVEV